MATITGAHRYINPRTGAAESVTVCAPVAKLYEYATSTGKDKYVCLGVVGNRAHLTARNPGDHTWFSRHTTFRKIGGPMISPKKGWIYAGDFTVPDQEKFEKWLLARLRAGVYIDVIKYFNVNNRHWNRKAVRGGKMFAYYTYSPDHHFHVSGMPGAEYAIVDLFGDYEYYRDNGKNRRPAGAVTPAPGKTPTPAKPTVKPVDVAAHKLGKIQRGAKGRLVGLAQAALVAQGRWPQDQARKQIDRVFGGGTYATVRSYQASHGIEVTGAVDTRTWAFLMPEIPPTIHRGSSGYYAVLMQCLLLAWGYDPGPVDGDFGDRSVDALKRFQAAQKVKNSVVKGRGDGIGGTRTWVALLTP